jgi:hypothetical protein
MICHTGNLLLQLLQSLSYLFHELVACLIFLRLERVLISRFILLVASGKELLSILKF